MATAFNAEFYRKRYPACPTCLTNQYVSREADTYSINEKQIFGYACSQCKSDWIDVESVECVIENLKLKIEKWTLL